MAGPKNGKKTLYQDGKGLYPTRNCRKTQYESTKSTPKFGIDTYMKERVTLKQSYSVANMINV